MTDPARAEEMRAFLAAAGWGDAALSPLAGDASNRRYERVRDGARGAVLMDAPAARGEDLSVFVALTGLLRDLGLSAPEVYALDLDLGLALIEDLGDDLFARICAARPGREPALYGAAVDLLARLHEAPAPETARGYGAAATIGPYDEAALRREAMLALEWWRPAAAGVAEDPDLAESYAALIAAACPPPAGRGVLTLRDYHAENLIWLPDRAGDRRVGLLDYQDALAGAPAYDLVSLLEDARRDTGPALRAAMFDRYAAARGLDGAARAAFEADYAALGAQRNLKIVGIFARLWLRDGKPAYLDLIPRVWAHLSRDLAHPRLAELRRLVEAEIPAPTEAALAAVRGGGR